MFLLGLRRFVPRSGDLAPSKTLRAGSKGTRPRRSAIGRWCVASSARVNGSWRDRSTRFSVLAPGRKPAEPRAKVWSYRRSAATEIPSDRTVAADSPVAHRGRGGKDWEMEELRRRADANPNADIDRVLQAMRYELGYDSELKLNVIALLCPLMGFVRPPGPFWAKVVALEPRA